MIRLLYLLQALQISKGLHSRRRRSASKLAEHGRMDPHLIHGRQLDYGIGAVAEMVNGD
jgi:hypothetical protein